ncbi:hypothetical protein PACTADRAFT_3397 [Pachysolen tannophilus NRRL Y-2460]|uniref:Inosine/uridine-preferring nucleoside hydrolase domain-containing protein n=1 Tax=Pachysolen tannophilus NRRL Y-2460 TaxID=669874 RepID=A0A1E4TVA6_PACTA|nr:hypothetical protein PACTADRAFT_3397 [Pachysolen tannophilus NRRL Y-2460]
MAEKSIKVPLWLDCDPGNDDAVAILVAAFHDEFKLLGISTVHGNSSLTNTTNNALSLMTALNRTDVPVYQGFDSPLVLDPRHAPHIHGELGLGGSNYLPKTEIGIKGKSEEMLKTVVSAINNYPNEISLVAVGPLTNIAKLITKYPQVKSKIKYLSIMGGAVSERTWKIGEFNITCDPHAAHTVLTDPILSSKTILIPSDLTHKAIAYDNIQKAILNEPNVTKLRRLFYEIITAFADAYKFNKGFLKGPPVHDPLAVVCLLSFYDLQNKNCNLLDFKYKRYKIDVIHGYAGTVDNGRVLLLEKANDGVLVGDDMNMKVFWDIVLDAIKVADDFSKAREK